MSDPYNELDDLNFSLVIKGLSPVKQRVAQSLVDGDNLNQIGIREGITRSNIYKIRDELAVELSFLKKENGWVEERTAEDMLIETVKEGISKMKLSDFAKLYLSPYHNISIKAIRDWEHSVDVQGNDRVIVAMSFLIRELFIRRKPVVIDYYYSDRSSLVKLISTFKSVVKHSPIVHDCLSVMKTDADLGVKLKDGSQVRMVWSKGKLPQQSGTLVILDCPIYVKQPKISVITE